MHGPQSTRRREQTNRLKALTEVRESPGSGSAPPSDKPRICPTGCVALVLHEPELPRFVDTNPLSGAGGVHEPGQLRLKPRICPTGCVALVLHEPELPRFVDSPCPRKWIGVHETGS